jgi:hypothetical protein
MAGVTNRYRGYTLLASAFSVSNERVDSTKVNEELCQMKISKKARWNRIIKVPATSLIC